MKALLGGAPPDQGALIVTDTIEWPFRRTVTPPPASPSLSAAAIHIRNLHLAFPAGQISGTRLVLTQSTYQLQRWLDWESSAPDAAVTADANEAVMRRVAPEAFVRRGPWARIELVEGTSAHADDALASNALHAAFVQPGPERRRDACADAAAADPGNPALLLALASAHIELQDLTAALDTLEAALARAGDWEAVHFELGKARLRADDTPGAAEAFLHAVELMPTFATAWSNLGAALGEMERRDESLIALQYALEHDPYGHPVLNNLGVALRDLGRLAEAETAFRQVIEIAPAFVFARYNLAHTLFLARDYRRARDAYEDAFASDPQKSARQSIRLAVARAATGDRDGAVTALENGLSRMDGAPRAQAIGEAKQALSEMASGSGRDQEAIAQLLRVLDAADTEPSRANRAG